MFYNNIVIITLILLLLRSRGTWTIYIADYLWLLIFNGLNISQGISKRMTLDLSYKTDRKRKVKHKLGLTLYDLPYSSDLFNIDI